jgi:hypothetical protein
MTLRRGVINQAAQNLSKCGMLKRGGKQNKARIRSSSNLLCQLCQLCRQRWCEKMTERGDSTCQGCDLAGPRVLEPA